MDYEFEIINKEKGIQNLGGNEEMFVKLMTEFEELSLDKYLNEMSKYIKTNQWFLVCQTAHFIRKASNYIAAERLILACERLKIASNFAKEKETKKFYFELLNESRLVKLEIAKQLNRQPKIEEVDGLINEAKNARMNISRLAESQANQKTSCCDGCVIF